MPMSDEQPTTTVRDRLVQRWRASFPGTALARAHDLDLGVSSLALGAQEVLCTAPMLVALSSVMAHFHLGFVGGFLIDLLGLEGSSASVVHQLFHSTHAPSSWTMWGGMALAVMFYVSVAAATQRCVDAVWNHESSMLRTLRVRLTWVAVQVPGFAAAFFVGHFLHQAHLPIVVTNVAYAVTLGIATALFHWWGHHVFLAGTVSWRQLVPGTVAIGLGVFALTIASPWIVPDQISDSAADYGLIGAAFVLSLWAVCYSVIVVYGTLLGQVWHARRMVGQIG